MSRFVTFLLTAAFIILAALIALGLFASIARTVEEANEPESGTVTELTYHEPRTSRICIQYLRGVCVNYSTTNHPEYWEVIYQDSDGNRGDDEITESEYDSLRVGDFYQQQP